MVSVLRADIFLNALLGFVALAILLLLLINPADQDDAPPPGSLSVYASWPEGPIDVDLWTLAPGEPGPVGFSNKTGLSLSLLRDDLGTSNDTLPANFENAYSRGLPAGEYVINLHCYNCRELPVAVTVEVRISRAGQDSVKMFSARVELVSHRQEITVVRFKLDADGNLVKGSMHNVFRPLYGARAAGQ